MRYMGRDEKDRALYQLTPREIEVMRLIGVAHADKEIADRLGMAEPTVRSHIREVKSRLHLVRRREIVQFIMQHPEMLRGESFTAEVHDPDPDCICPFCMAMAVPKPARSNVVPLPLRS